MPKVSSTYSINMTITMTTDMMKNSTSVFIALFLGVGNMAAQESFPAYLPADTMPPTVIWATPGHSCVVSNHNMSKTGEAFIKSVDYHDGFGRLEETVMHTSGQSGTDIATYYEMDNFGRLSNKWLPVPVSQAAGSFVSKATCSSLAASTYDDAAPSTSLAYEGSPLSRITSETGPGAAWRSAGKSAWTVPC